MSQRIKTADVRGLTNTFFVFVTFKFHIGKRLREREREKLQLQGCFNSKPLELNHLQFLQVLIFRSETVNITLNSSIYLSIYLSIWSEMVRYIYWLSPSFSNLQWNLGAFVWRDNLLLGVNVRHGGVEQGLILALAAHSPPTLRIHQQNVKLRSANSDFSCLPWWYCLAVLHAGFVIRLVAMWTCSAVVTLY